MTSSAATLYMIFGKMAAGKSTLSAELSRPDNTILIAQDDWLGGLFADQLKTGADYLRISQMLDTVMGPHIIQLLQAGVSVVLDFPANTLAQRGHLRELFEAAGAKHELHVLDVPDDVCMARLKARNEAGTHPFAPTEAQFHAFMKHVVPPTEEEGFNLIHHRV